MIEHLKQPVIIVNSNDWLKIYNICRTINKEGFGT